MEQRVGSRQRLVNLNLISHFDLECSVLQYFYPEMYLSSDDAIEGLLLHFLRTNFQKISNFNLFFEAPSAPYIQCYLPIVMV